MNIWHPGQLKKWKSCGPFWNYCLNSTANPAHLPQYWTKLAKSAVLFSWKIQNGSQDFDFINCHGYRLFILCELHCYLCPHIFWVYYFGLSQCVPCSLELASEHCNALAAFRFHSCLAAGHVARFFLEGFIWFSHQIKRKKRVKEPP